MVILEVALEFQHQGWEMRRNQSVTRETIQAKLFHLNTSLPALFCAETQTAGLHWHSSLSWKQLNTMVKDFIVHITVLLEGITLLTPFALNKKECSLYNIQFIQTKMKFLVSFDAKI